MVFFFSFSRRETTQVRGVLQGVQPIVEPDHAPAQALGLQAVPVRPVRQGVPAQGGPAQAPREPAPRVTGTTVSHYQHHGPGGRARHVHRGGLGQRRP